MNHKSLRHVTHHIDKRLRFRLRLYFFITVILIGIFIFNILRGTLNLQFGIFGLLGGILVGVISSRMYHISWNHDAKKVIGRLDLYGIIILILYIIFEFMRERIVAYFTHDVQVATVGFAVLAGIMLGRVMGTRGKILRILEEQEIFG